MQVSENLIDTEKLNKIHPNKNNYNDDKIIVDNNSKIKSSNKLENKEKDNHPEQIEQKHHHKKDKNTTITKVKSFLKNKYNLTFLIIILLTFLIRLKYIGQESIWNDAAVHLWFAVKVIKEPLFFFSKEYLLGDHVVPQTITAFFYLFTKNAFLAGKIMAIFYGLVGVTFMYLLGSELKNKTTGLIGAALLGFNHLFWFYGVRPLADGPLTVTGILIIYFVVKLEKTKKMIFGILAGLSFILMIVTKQSGVLFILPYLLYLIIFKMREMIKDKSILVSWLIPVGLIAIGSAIFKHNFISDLTQRLVHQYGLKDGSFLNVFHHLQWIFSWYILIPIILGIILIILYKKKEYYFLVILFLFVTIYLEIGVRSVEDRIVMPVLPIGIFLAVFFLTEIGQYITLFVRKKHVGMALVLVFIILVCWNFYTIGDNLIYQKSFSYGGHPEAGQWIKKNVPEDAIVFSGAPRIIRAFSERAYGGPGKLGDGGIEKNGTIWWLRSNRYVENQTLFEEDLAELSKDHEVYLEINVWEYTQPSWYFPLNQNSINYFTNLGFNLVKVIERNILTPQGLQKMPVIFIFKYKKR